MKLENVTKQDRRWYDDACGAALAMELVGERWALLIVRELLFGPRRFSALRASLPGISANVLTQRLAGLEQARVLRRRRLDPPAGVQVYELTPWGYEAEGAVLALARWASRSPAYDPTQALSATAMMLSLRNNIDVDAARALPAVMVGFALGDDSFVLRLEGGAPVIRRGRERGDVHFATTPRLLANIIYGKWPLETARAEGALVLAGDPALAQSFVDLFRLPAKAEVE